MRDQKERRTKRKETAIQMKKWKLYKKDCPKKVLMTQITTMV